MSSSATPYWKLIAVLFSSQTMSPALAMTLYRTALDLYVRGGDAAILDGEAMYGKVRNLGTDLLLGTIGGPAFEAEVETERGKLTARFLLTRAALDQPADAGPPDPYMN